MIQKITSCRALRKAIKDVKCADTGITGAKSSSHIDCLTTCKK